MYSIYFGAYIVTTGNSECESQWMGHVYPSHVWQMRADWIRLWKITDWWFYMFVIVMTTISSQNYDCKVLCFLLLLIFKFCGRFFFVWSKYLKINQSKNGLCSSSFINCNGWLFYKVCIIVDCFHIYSSCECSDDDNSSWVVCKLPYDVAIT